LVHDVGMAGSEQNTIDPRRIGGIKRLRHLLP
jgi:hypothetical protein